MEGSVIDDMYNTPTDRHQQILGLTDFVQIRIS
jgi:hypothetical protein